MNERMKTLGYLILLKLCTIKVHTRWWGRLEPRRLDNGRIHITGCNTEPFKILVKKSKIQFLQNHFFVPKIQILHNHFFREKKKMLGDFYVEKIQSFPIKNIP